MEEIENTEVNTRPKTAPPVLFTPSKYASASHVKTPKSSARNMSALSTPNQGSPTSSTASSAREAARIAKITSTAEKVRKVAELKVKWAEEKERKLQLNSAQRANELKRLQDNSQMAAESRRKNAEVRRATEQEKKTLEQEQLSISLEACTQLALDLEQMRKDRRRKSVLLNADITKKAKEREQRILQEHKEAEVDLLASKRIDAISVQCAKKVDEERRRESLIGRGKIHLKHREITSELAKREAEEDRSLLEFRHEAWKKSQEAKVEKYERDRQSIAGRLDSWRDQRVVQKGLEDKEFDSYTDTMTSRRNDWTDIQSYKQSLARRDRQSLAGRLDKWREEKCIEARRREQVAEAREYEAELQRQAMEDLRAYESTLQSSRRDSLAYRLEKARQDKSFEEGQQIIQASIEAEERRIQDLDRQDVENYRQRMQDAIRQSLEYRNQSEVNKLFLVVFALGHSLIALISFNFYSAVFKIVACKHCLLLLLFYEWVCRCANGTLW